MKKITGALAILLAIALIFICRQLHHYRTKTLQPHASIPAAIDTSIALGTMLMQ